MAKLRRVPSPRPRQRRQHLQRRARGPDRPKRVRRLATAARRTLSPAGSSVIGWAILVDPDIPVTTGPAQGPPPVPPPVTATRWAPFVSDARATHTWPDAAVPAVSLVHVVPESTDVQTSWPLSCADAAARRAPVASDATATHCPRDAPVPAVWLVQVAPASADVQMSPPERPPSDVPYGEETATRWVPVESDATLFQSVPDAGVPLVRSYPGRARVRRRPDVAVCGDRDQVGCGRVRGQVNPGLSRRGGSRRPVGPGRARVIGRPDIAIGKTRSGSRRVGGHGGPHDVPGGGGHRCSFGPRQARVRGGPDILHAGAESP